jgi:hypothetical protein
MRSPRTWVFGLATLLLLGLKIAGPAAAPLFLWSSAACALLLVTVWLLGSVPWLDGWRVALLLFGLAGLGSVYTGLSGDGVEYYSLLRSPLLDHDLDLSNDFEGFHFQPLTTPGGRPVARQGVGVALLWAPFVVPTHVLVRFARAFGAGVAADGFSPPYQAACTVATFVYGFLALVLLEGRLRLLYGPALAGLSALALYFATPLHFYLVANPFMSHGVSVFAATLFVLLWMRARTASSAREWALVGVAGGLMALVRSHDTVLLLLPFVDLVRGERERRLRLTAAYLLAPAVLALLQIGVWRSLYGPEFVEGVLRINRVHGFALHPLDVLVSPRHGLLTWTPLSGLAIAGLLLFFRRNASLALLFLLGVVGVVLVNSVFDDWWGSQSFGQRRLLSLTPIFAFGLAEGLLLLKRRPLVPVGALLLGLALWNLQFEAIYNSDLAGEKWEAVSLDALASAQVDLLYRRVLARSESLPRGLFVRLYDGLKGVWLDEGSRSLKGRVLLADPAPPVSFLVGDGWYRPEAEGGVAFRKSRGRRSSLHVPIRTPGDFEALLRARLELQEVPVEVSLDVNGVDCGTAEIAPGWNDYPFPVPGSAIEPGINAFVLRYSTTPRKARPGESGRNAAIAVESLRLRRTAGALPSR